MQRIRQLKLGWDESLPADLHTEWVTYIKEFNAINNISVPRAIICMEPALIEIHGFSDASENVYGACVYLRLVDKIGKVKIRLICAKSRVAPLKTISIPRLELCATVLMAKLVNSVARAITLPLNNLHY